MTDSTLDNSLLDPVDVFKKPLLVVGWSNIGLWVQWISNFQFACLFNQLVYNLVVTIFVNIQSLYGA